MRAEYLWALLGGFFVGVAFFDLIPLGLSFCIFLAFLGVALAASSRSLKVIICAIALCAAGAGALRVHLADRASVSALDEHIGERISLIGSITDEPDRRETSVRLTVLPYMVGLSGGEEVAVERSGRVLVPVQLPASFSYGDIVRVRGVIGYPEVFENDGRSFDYPAFLAARGIYYELPFADVEIIKPRGVSVRGTLFDIKNAYLAGLQRALPEPHASLAGGITVGDKRSLGDKLTEQFQKTGLVHIVVLSGYNITLIVGALMLLVRNMPLRWRFVLGGGAVLAFVLMTGASATGVRAGAMAGIALLAAAAYRKYAIDRALALTAAAMVLWNPHVLLYDPGFQLSVIATLGLIHVSPLFEKKLAWMPERFELRSIAAATLGTQAAVLPLLIHQTGLLSLVSLPANLLVLPAIPLAMITSFAAGIAGSLFETIGIVIGLPAYVLLSYVVWMTELLAKIPLGSVELPAFSGWWVMAAYAGLLILFRWYKNKSAGDIPAGVVVL